MKRGRVGRGVWAVCCVLALSGTLVACAEDGGTGGTGDEGGGTAAGSDCAQFEKYGDLSGTTVTVFTPIVAPEDQPHIDSYQPFEDCTGATIAYEGSDEFEAQLNVRVEGGNAPDIAYVPQPGLLRTLVSQTDAVMPAPKETEANVDEYWSREWKEYGTVDGTFYAAPVGANVKSFIWYSPTAFQGNDYQVPQTWEQLIELSDQIVADGGKPWCAGIASGDATGWPATDWLEDVMLRVHGPEVYDQWTNHEIPFDDERVAEVLQRTGSILKNPDYVNGGLGDVRSIAATSDADAGLPILEEQCYLHRAASFYQANWPEGTEISENGDVFAFYFPSIDEQHGNPVLGAGEFAVAFDDRPEVQAFQTYLSSPEWANRKAELGNWISANQGLDIENVDTEINRLSVELLQDSESVFRFDASDMMPGEIGADALWSEMEEWFATDKSDQAVLRSVERAWNRLD